MNKKLVRNIILAVVFVALLAGVYFVVDKWQPDNSSESIGEGTATSAKDDIYIFKLKLDDMIKVEINNGKETLVIEKNGTEFTAPGLEEMRLTKAKLPAPFLKFEELRAERLVSEDGNPAEYGLDNPKAFAIVTMSDGTTEQLLIGNSDPTAIGHYVKTDKDSKIYLVLQNDLKPFFAGVDDYRNLNISNFAFDTLLTLEIYRGDELITSIRKRNDTDTLTDIVIEEHIMTYPFYEYVSLAELSVPFEAINSVEAIDVVSDTADNPEKYGIGAYTFKYEDDYGKHVIKLGNRDEKGNVYAMYEGVDSIYTLDPEWLKIAEEFKPFDYLYKLTNVYMIDDVKEVSFVSPSGSYKLTAERKDSTEYKINDKKVDEYVFKDAYTELMSMSFTADGRGSAQGKEIGSVTFTFNDGQVDSSKYYEVDERNYLVVKGNGAKYLVLRKNFDVVYNNISDLIKE